MWTRWNVCKLLKGDGWPNKSQRKGSYDQINLLGCHSIIDFYKYLYQSASIVSQILNSIFAMLFHQKTVSFSQRTSSDPNSSLSKWSPFYDRIKLKLMKPLPFELIDQHGTAWIDKFTLASSSRAWRSLVPLKSFRILIATLTSWREPRPSLCPADEEDNREFEDPEELTSELGFGLLQMPG